MHRGESLNGVTWFSTPPLPAYIIGYIESIRESIKQESGANDFSRGMATGGVTAASAISAMQEMSNKRARMIARILHESFRDAVRLEIEVEREFNFFTRKVNVTIDGETRECTFESAMLVKRAPGNAVLPIEFYISVKAQQETKYSAMSQNELALKMLQSGMTTPAQAVELMVFQGKDQLLKQLKEQSENAQATQQQMIPPIAGKTGRNATLVFGSDAYGIIDVDGEGCLQTIVKPVGSGGAADPLDQRATVGAKVAAYTAKILNNLWMVRIEHGVSL